MPLLSYTMKGHGWFSGCPLESEGLGLGHSLSRTSGFGWRYECSWVLGIASSLDVGSSVFGLAPSCERKIIRHVQ